MRTGNFRVYTEEIVGIKANCFVVFLSLKHTNCSIGSSWDRRGTWNALEMELTKAHGMSSVRGEQVLGMVNGGSHCFLAVPLP